MKWESFLQLTLSFIMFILSILIFRMVDLDVNFIVTFILAIFSLSISIFFFTETSKFFSKMGDKLTIIQEKVTTSKFDKKRVKGLNILDTIDISEIIKKRRSIK